MLAATRRASDTADQPRRASISMGALVIGCEAGMGWGTGVMAWGDVGVPALVALRSVVGATGCRLGVSDGVMEQRGWGRG